MKSGFVAIVGRSNVGKSTLVNTMVGSKVAITTPKPQTTRRPIQGVITRPEGQMIIIDTPGVMQKAKDDLTKKLLDYAKTSLHDVEAIAYVCDPTRAIGDEEKQALKLIEHSTKPKILVINKMDDKAHHQFIGYYRDLAKKFDAYAEVSALTGSNVDRVTRWLFDQLPEGEIMYPEFQITNLRNQDWVAELIREKLYLRLREEVPYSTHVEVDEMAEREDGTMYISATIYTNAERYKPMIIGARGQGIKEIGQAVRNELTAVADRKYYIDLHVAVDQHWLGKYDD
jgi:GTP-binding protein Era